MKLNYSASFDNLLFVLHLCQSTNCCANNSQLTPDSGIRTSLFSSSLFESFCPSDELNDTLTIAKTLLFLNWRKKNNNYVLLGWLKFPLLQLFLLVALPFTSVSQIKTDFGLDRRASIRTGEGGRGQGVKPPQKCFFAHWLHCTYVCPPPLQFHIHHSISGL